MSNRKFPNEFRIRIHSDSCIYCGEWATEDEHWPPYCCGPQGYLFRSCRECNSLAGTEWPYDLVKRSAHVKAKLEQRYGRQLRLSDELTVAELAEQDERTWLPTLEEYKAQAETIERLDWDTLSFIATIDHNDVFVHEDYAADDEAEDPLEGPAIDQEPGQDWPEYDGTILPNLWE